jgi:hypothetical protein
MAAQPTRPTNTTIADIFDVSSVTFGGWLDGTIRPRDHNRVAIHRLTGIEPESWRTAEERVKLADSLARVDAFKAREAA